MNAIEQDVARMVRERVERAKRRKAECARLNAILRPPKSGPRIEQEWEPFKEVGPDDPDYLYWRERRIQDEKDCGGRD